MLMSEAEVLTGYRNVDLVAFVAGCRDGEWLSLMDMPCWPENHVCRWTPYEDGRMHGWFEAPQPPNATMDKTMADVAAPIG